MQRTHIAITQGQYFNPDELISFSSQMKHLSVLRTQLCRLPLKNNGSGKIQIMSKPDMKNHKPPINSPNLGDSAMMTMINPIKKREYKPLSFDTIY